MFFYFFGFTLNTMTLMALSLSIGMLIDDAIVVLENIYRHMEEAAEPAADAASTGTDEIGLAVIATTLAICAVFVPIAFMSGVVGRFFREFGLVATCAVLVSMLVALTLDPDAVLPLPARRSAGRGASSGRSSRGYRALEAHYRRVLALGPAPSAGGGGARPRGGARRASRMARAVPVDFVIAGGPRRVQRLAQAAARQHRRADAGATAERSRRSCARCPEVRAVFSTIGGGRQEARQRGGALRAARPQEPARGDAAARSWTSCAGASARWSCRSQDFAVEEIGFISLPGSRNAQLMYAIRGPDIDRLQLYARDARSSACGRPAATPTSTLSYETGKPEIALEITRERAADLGVPGAPDRAHHLRAASPASRRRPSRRAASATTCACRCVPSTATTRRSSSWCACARRAERSSRCATWSPRASAAARCRSTARAAPAPSPSTRQPGRQGGGRRPTSRSRASRGSSASPASTSSRRSGPTERLRETTAAILFAFVLALVAIYMILAAQFNSFVHPFTIMLSAPLSFIGAFAAICAVRLFARRDGPDRVPDADGHRDEERHPARRLHQHAARARPAAARGRARGRPDAAAPGADDRGLDDLRHAAGRLRTRRRLRVAQPDGRRLRSAAWSTSTLLTLLVVPVVYTLVDDAQRAGSRALARLFGRSQPRDADVQSA